jgi:hypothetical protein
MKILPLFYERKGEWRARRGGGVEISVATYVEVFFLEAENNDTKRLSILLLLL